VAELVDEPALVAFRAASGISVAEGISASRIELTSFFAVTGMVLLVALPFVARDIVVKGRVVSGDRAEAKGA